MKYKYMEADVKEAKRLAEEHKDMQTYQDIYKERLEVLRKAKAFDEVIKASQKEKTYEQLGFSTSRIASEYWRDKTMTNLQIKLLSENATMPTRANATDSGLDLYVSETTVIEPHTTAAVKTDVAISLPYGYEAQVRPRSGKSLKTKLRVTLGTIDLTYHKEIGIITDNIGDEPITIEQGERLAQLVIAPVSYMQPVEVKQFEYESERGGFGSTGY